MQNKEEEGELSVRNKWVLLCFIKFVPQNKEQKEGENQINCTFEVKTRKWSSVRSYKRKYKALLNLCKSIIRNGILLILHVLCISEYSWLCTSVGFTTLNSTESEKYLHTENCVHPKYTLLLLFPKQYRLASIHTIYTAFTWYEL